MTYPNTFQWPVTQHALGTLNKQKLEEIKAWVEETHRIVANSAAWGGDIVAKRNDMRLLKSLTEGFNALIDHAG